MHAIAAEIHYFRMRVGEHCLTRESQEDTEGLEHEHEQDNTNTSVNMHESRTRFSANVQQIVIQVCTAHLSTDALTFNENDTLKCGPTLAKHVNRHVYADNRTAGTGTVDNLCPLSNAEYFEHRVKPLLRSVSTSAPVLKSWYGSLQLLVFLTTALATVLGAIGQQTWILVAISLSTFFTTLMVESNLKEWLAGTQRAVGELQAMALVWNGVPIPRSCYYASRANGIAQLSSASCSPTQDWDPLTNV